MVDFARELLARVQKEQDSEALAPVNLAEDEPTVEVETVDRDHETSTAGPGVTHSTVTRSNLFSNHDTHPLVLDCALLNEYGPEWLGWEPETVALHVTSDFKGGLSHVNFDKIQAVCCLHLVDTFWQRWEVFNWCLMALNGILPDFDVLQVPTAAQCLVAVDIANRVRDDVGWSAEVRTFIETVFRHDQVFFPIEPCGFIPMDVTGFPIDQQEIARTWPLVRDHKGHPSVSPVTEEQLNRLTVLHGYLTESRRRLLHQLPLVAHA